MIIKSLLCVLVQFISNLLHRAVHREGVEQSLKVKLRRAVIACRNISRERYARDKNCLAHCRSLYSANVAGSFYTDRAFWMQDENKHWVPMLYPRLASFHRIQETRILFAPAWKSPKNHSTLVPTHVFYDSIRMPVWGFLYAKNRLNFRREN